MRYFLRFLGVIGGGVILVALVLFFLPGNESLSDTTPSLHATNSAASGAFADAPDADGDGAPDWLEELWGTDPHNPDTNGDGISDKEEIEASIAQRGERAKTEDPVQKATAAIPEGESTVTSEFARKLLASTIYLKQTGRETDMDRRATVQGLLLESDIGIPELSGKYSAQNVSLSASNDNEVWRAYGNAALAVVDIYRKQNPRNEFLIYEEVLRTKKPEAVAELLASAHMYESIALAIAQIAAPSELSVFHPEWLNGYMTMAEGLRDMAASLEDPLRGTKGFHTFLLGQESVVTTVSKIGLVFKARNIPFLAAEPGYAWIAE